MSEAQQEHDGEKKLKNPEEVEKILEKVKKILALADRKSGSHLGEAENAAEIAARLMAEYNLSHEDVILSEIKDRSDGCIISETVYSKNAGGPAMHFMSTLTVGIGKLFDCEIKWGWTDGGKEALQIYGYRTDVKVAKWTIGFVLDQITKAAVDALVDGGVDVKGGKRGALKFINSFYLGASAGVWVVVKREIARKEEETRKKQAATGSGSTALMIVKKDAIIKRFGNFNYGKVKNIAVDRNAYGSGQRAGERINLNRPINQGEGRRMIG